MVWVLLSITLLTAGCLGSKEICPDGFEYNAQIGLCFKEQTDDDGGRSDTAGDAGEAGFDGGGASGIGESCTDNPDCAAYDADFCALDPMSRGEGYCTAIDCLPGQCAQGYQCCDCTSSDVMPAEMKIQICFKDADAQMSSLAGCGCR